jgi:hypothetical protein
MKRMIIRFIQRFGYHFFKVAVDDLVGTRDPIIRFRKEECEESYQHFKKYFDSSVLFESEESIREYALKESLRNSDKNKNECDGLYFEFGVFKGASINQFAQILSRHKKSIYGFDSFYGLDEDWFGTSDPKGTFNLDGAPPKVENNVKLIVGKVQETLPVFLKKHSDKKINFIHLDLDTYSATKLVLQNIKPFLNEGCILLFDELYNYSGWRVGEHKALMEIFEEKEFKYIAFQARSIVAIKYLRS